MPNHGCRFAKNIQYKSLAWIIINIWSDKRVPMMQRWVQCINSRPVINHIHISCNYNVLGRWPLIQCISLKMLIVCCTRHMDIRNMQQQASLEGICEHQEYVAFFFCKKKKRKKNDDPSMSVIAGEKYAHAHTLREWSLWQSLGSAKTQRLPKNCRMEKIKADLVQGVWKKNMK